VMLTRLGELLRLTLRSDPDHETPLHEEMAVLERYLAIMRMRFADRVTVDCAVDPAVANALVPSFILQPIVENAFEHGVARTQRPGRIEIEARPAQQSLVLVVHDNGPGPSNGESGNGVGLSNTRRRLAELYGVDGSLSMFNPAGGGTTVEVRLPLRLAFAPGLHRLRITFLNRVVKQPVTINCDVQGGKITPMAVSLTATGQTTVLSKQVTVGGTQAGLGGRRTKINSDETVMYKISALSGAAVPFQPKNLMHYTN